MFSKIKKFISSSVFSKKRDQEEQVVECENSLVCQLSEQELARREITKISIGLLNLENGEVVACDPLVQAERDLFKRKVSPGTYPVNIYYSSNVPGVAELRFSDVPIVSWEMALTVTQNLADLEGDEIFAYPVDAGFGCFMSSETNVAMEQREKLLREEQGKEYSDYYNSFLYQEFEDSAKNSSVPFEWCNHYPIPGTQANCIMFRSGWGDGFYSSYWGLDENNDPVVLITDFYIFENADGRDEEDRYVDEQIQSLTEEQQTSMNTAEKYIENDEAYKLQKLLLSGQINPEWIVPESHESLTFAAIRLQKPDCLRILIDNGASRYIPNYLKQFFDDELETYLDYVDWLNKAPGENIYKLVQELDQK